MIDIYEEGLTLIVSFSGEVDHHIADVIRNKIDKAILKSNCTSVLFDFTNLVFTDSTGIGLILGRYKLLKSRNMPLVIKKPNPTVSKVLNATGIFSIIKVVE